MINNINGLHIEPTNICTLKCPGCSRTDLISQWPQHWKNHFIDIPSLMNFIDIDLTNKTILFCGNYGDPIYHPDFINLVSKFKEKKSKIHIITNGSYKTPNWWIDLCNLLDDKDIITFSIDGTPDNFTNYRINADWNSIKQGIQICVTSKCKTRWKYIPFLYNQDNIDQARELSLSLGIDEFFIDPSNRFNDNTLHLKPTENLISSTYKLQLEWKNTTDHLDIDPICKNGQQHFISAEGYYASCCMLSDYRFYYKTIFGKNKQDYNIINTTLTSILNQPKVINFYDSLSTNKGCQYFCPKKQG